MFFATSLKEKQKLLHHYVTTAQEESRYCIGLCPFALLKKTTSRVLSQLPSDPDQVNAVMCGLYKRRDLLYGQCISGHGPGVNQFHLKCANCSNFSTEFAVYRFVSFII